MNILHTLLVLALSGLVTSCQWFRPPSAPREQCGSAQQEQSKLNGEGQPGGRQEQTSVARFTAQEQAKTQPREGQEQKKVNLEQLTEKTSQANWEQFFSERNAQEFWKTLNSGSTSLSFDFEASHIFHQLHQEVANGIIRYLAQHKVNLEELSIENGKFEQLDDFIEELQTLRKLHLNDNNLTYLSESIGKLPNLRLLYLSDNWLSALPYSIGGLQNLEELYLYNNLLSYLPKSIGHLLNLRLLDLAGNRLIFLPRSVGNLQNLEQLNLFNNNLSVLPKSLRKLRRLYSLDLADNNLSVLPKSLRKLRRLYWLHLADNNLSVLPKSLRKLPNLYWLDLTGNPDLLTNLSQAQSETLWELHKQKVKIKGLLGDIGQRLEEHLRYPSDHSAEQPCRAMSMASDPQWSVRSGLGSLSTAEQKKAQVS